jgi:lipid-binding SYLF domain-containing protein
VGGRVRIDKNARIYALLILCVSLLPAANQVADKRPEEAADVFREIMDAPDKAIPQTLLEKARCVLIVPE